MSRIPQNFIDDLLDRTDIIDVIGSRVQLKKSGKNYMGLCPFHNEKSPSFSVNADKQFYHCFGCGAGGDSIKFLMDYEHVEFVNAIEELARLGGVEVPREESPQDRERHRLQNELYELLKKCSDYFYQQLKTAAQRQDAVGYLKSRGLSGQIAKAFQIGFAPPGWQQLLEQFGQTPEQRNLLLQAGLTVENEAGRSYDRFRHRVIFPIRDSRGRVVGFGGRVLNDDKPKYLNSPETPVFHKSQELYGLYEAKKAQSKLERVLIVEGYMDVVSLAQFGISYSVATLGTATSQSHLERLFKLVDDIVFCFDGDEAGRNAAWRALDTAIPMLGDERQIRVLFLPDGEDPDTLVRVEGKEAFEQRVREATPVTDLLFQKCREGIDLDSLDGKAKYAKIILDWIQKLPEKTLLRALMRKRLADITGLSEQALGDLPEEVLEESTATPKAPEKALPKTRVPIDYSELHNAKSGSKHSLLSPTLKAIANLLRDPKLISDVEIPEAMHDEPDAEVHLLVSVIDLLTASPVPLADTFVTCDWLHDQGLKEPLKPIEDSDYFWLVDSQPPDQQIDWLKSELVKNLQKMMEKLPDQEYEYLKNRMTHHSSEVTEEERNRFTELVRQRKNRR